LRKTMLGVAVTLPGLATRCVLYDARTIRTRQCYPPSL
jgi:hypothetical protein